MTDAFFTLRDVCSGYGSVPIIFNVDLTVQEGEIGIILGRNGVGKTTLMRTIIGLLPLTRGDIVLGGKPIGKTATYQRAQAGIAYVPQGRGIFPNLTVEENLVMGEGVNTTAESRPYDEIYGYFPRLRERRTQKGGTLSGGEQQMLAIGRAMIGNPKFMLLDEPSEGVQPNIVQEIGQVLARLNAEDGLTILLVEQNIDYALHIAQRCHIMTKGRIVDCLEKWQLSDPETVNKYLAI